MEQSPSWEANRFSASQEIPHTLWNQNVHYRIYKTTAPVPNLNQINPVHASPSHSGRSFLILSSHLHLRLPSDLFPSVSHTKTLYLSLLSPIQCYMLRPSNFIYYILFCAVLCLMWQVRRKAEIFNLQFYDDLCKIAIIMIKYNLIHHILNFFADVIY